MATILTKKSDTSSSVPLAADLTNAAGGAELAVNTADKRLYSKTSGGTIVELGTNPSSMTLPNGTANGVPYLNGSKVLTSGSALTFDGSNLGLGVTPSASNLATIQSAYGILSGNSQTNIAANAYYNSQWVYTSTAIASLYTQTAGQHRFFTAPSGTAGNAISFTQAMTLDASGRLGIGNTSPSYLLDVLAGGTGHSGVQALAQLRSATDAISNAVEMLFTPIISGQTKTAIGGVREGVTANAALYFTTNGTERARIDSSGNLLVGSTATQNGDRLYIQSSNFVVGINGTNTTGEAVRFYQNGTTCGTISYTASTVSYNTTSDYRLKTVIGAVSDAGQRIDALEPIEYEWNSDGSRTRGFLAHKFQEVYAGSVTGTKDAVDKEGKPVYQAMQAGSSEVIADLVAEIQSLRKRLAALESK